MTKKSQRSIMRYEKDHAGCMWGLIHVFDFRYGRTTRKLLSNRRHEYQHAVGDGYNNTKLKMLTNSADKSQTIEDSDVEEMAAEDFIKTRVKELMEGEMLVDQDSKNHTTNGQDSLHGRKNNNRRNKPSIESCDIHIPNSVFVEPENPCHQITEHKTSNDIDLESIMEALLKVRRSNDRSDNLDLESNKAYSLVEENLSTAIQLFMNQRFKNKDGNLIENGKIDLSLYKEMFLKLVSDAQMEEESNSKSRQVQPVDSKKGSFFRRRSKSRESNSLTENEKSQSSSRIVLLKPGPVAPQKLEDKMKKEEVKVHSDGKGGSQSSLDKIKKKLKKAMGKERPAQNGGTHIKIADFEENGGWSSPNRNHFFTERFARASKSSKFRESETDLMNQAKKHLSEMLNSEKENDDMLNKRISESLGRILSRHEYSFSPRSNFDRVDEDTWRFVQESPNIQLSSPRKELKTQLRDNMVLDLDVLPLELEESVSNDLSQDNIVEEREPSSQGLVEILNAAETVCEENKEGFDAEEDCCFISRDIEICGTSQVCEEVSPLCLKMDFLEEDQFFSSPSVSPLQSSSTRKLVEAPEKAVDKTERQSPVSVLEQFSEDDVSPPRAKSESVDTLIQSLQTRLNEHAPSTSDQEICIRTCLVAEESAFEYVEAVLLASDLNWNEYVLRWIGSNPPLDPSLYNEVELFSNRSCHDQKLLFDCTNEVLKEVCEHHFGCSSFGKNSVRPIPQRMDLINEVWEGVEWLLLCDPPPHSLDKLLNKDMAKYKTWINLEVEKESIMVELKNYILDELVEDAILGFINDEIREKKIQEIST